MMLRCSEGGGTSKDNGAMFAAMDCICRSLMLMHCDLRSIGLYMYVSMISRLLEEEITNGISGRSCPSPILGAKSWPLQMDTFSPRGPK